MIIKILVTSMPMFVCAVLTALVAMQWYEQRQKSKLFLLLFMAVSTVFQLSQFAYINMTDPVMPFTDTLFAFAITSIQVFYYFYIVSLTSHWEYNIHKMLWLLPSLICTVAVAAFYISMSSEMRTNFVENFLYNNNTHACSSIFLLQVIAHYAVLLVFYLLSIPVIYLSVRHIRRYNKSLAGNFSDVDDKALADPHPSFFLFMAIFVMSVIYVTIRFSPIIQNIWLLTAISVVYSVLLFLVGYHGLRNNFTMREMVVDQEEDTTETILPDSEHSVLRQQVLRLIDKEKIYLQPNLKISDLARRLNTNRSYIYNVINVEMGLSFAELINSKRVEYAVDLMQTNPNILLADVSILSGFTSTASFYRNFKKYRGTSPKDYLQSSTSND